MKNTALYSFLRQLRLEEQVIYKNIDTKTFYAGITNNDIQQRLQTIAPDAIYVFNEQPLILFFDLNQTERDIEDLYKKVWSFDHTSIIFIIKDKEIQVFNALNYIKEKKALEKIDISNEEINKLFNFWELESGETWKSLQKNHIEKQQNKSQIKRVNDKLFSNIKQVRESLILLNIEEDDANSLILRLIFIRYLIDRKIKIDDKLIQGDVEDINSRRKSLIMLIRSPELLNELFIKLNKRFNGVLFKNSTLELTEIQSEYLSNVFAGELQGPDSIFKDFFFEIFDFSIIPVEVISGIYESLINEETRKLDSAVYTPSFLID